MVQFFMPHSVVQHCPLCTTDKAEQLG